MLWRHWSRARCPW